MKNPLALPVPLREPVRATRRKWQFSLLLGLAYPAIFHLWLVIRQREAVVLSGVVVSLLLFWLLVRAGRQAYFANRWDLVFHAAVILDILLEATLIPVQQGFGFYWCAFAFAVVIGGYHAYQRRQPEFF
ncbi:MAG TPA: hypothetical protein VHH73_07575 [Verrucomicrobiae bacterium]|nr:hypothetical protein [Verrucomicrobiae bacterium]